jgi:hypothetical protein
VAPTLAQALAYQNEDIVQRFLSEWSIAPEDARILFDDVKRFLFLVEQPDGRHSTIHGPLVVLDEMWHNFVLFTKPYTEYCVSLYGHYIHHVPTTHTEIQRLGAELADQPEATRHRIAEQRARQREAIVRHLGVETLLRWYVDYPRKFTTALLAERRKPIEMGWEPDAELVAIAEQLRGRPEPR